MGPTLGFPVKEAARSGPSQEEEAEADDAGRRHSRTKSLEPQVCNLGFWIPKFEDSSGPQNPGLQ